MQVTGPGRGVADTPVYEVQGGINIAGHPGRAAAVLPVVALPGLVARFAGPRDGEGAPQLLAVIGVVGHNVAAHAVFAARTADENLAVHNERHQCQVLTLLVILYLLVPCHLAALGVERHDVIISGGEVELVLPKPYTAARRVQLREVLGDLPLVAPDLVSCLRVEGDDLVLRRCHKHDAVVDERRGLVAFADAGRKRPNWHQILDVGGVDLVKWAVALAVIGSAIEHPVAGLGIGEPVGGNRAVVANLARSRYCRPQGRRRRPASPYPVSNSHRLPPSSTTACLIG